MRHRVAGRKLQRTRATGRPCPQYGRPLIKHEQITTTLARRRSCGPMSRSSSRWPRRGVFQPPLAHARMIDDAQLKKLFDVVAPRYADRTGGYCRIIKAGLRESDAADRDHRAGGPRRLCKGLDSGPVQGGDEGYDEAA